MLTVYRASAGSGKTYTLTEEYLKLLFSSPVAYRHILAVTFTNKATDEMKGRIVEELHKLASGEMSDYTGSLTKDLSLDEPSLRREAQRVLVRILHDYAAFNISTIDRFFQQTMRAFAREIGLQGGYGLEMDTGEVLDAAIDDLISSLEDPGNKDLLGWLVRFAEEKVESGSGWNLRGDIRQLSLELFKETYKAFEKEVARDIADKQALEKYKESLFGMIRAEENRARKLGEEGLAVLDRYGLSPQNFKGGSHSPLFFLQKLAAGEMKEPSATFCSLADHVEAAYTTKTDEGLRQKIASAFDGGLNRCIKEIVHLFTDRCRYLTAKEIVRYYYTLGILSDVSARIATYRRDKNIMLLADTTELLNKVIGGSDTPFVYEKTGVRVDHYMIDEFQDTSGMQWNNFRPLITESLAHNRSNLIVGDVKQSIYRFRNSDWKLLDQQIRSDFRKEEITDKILGVNWRSCRSIVEFNNAFFTTAPLLLQALFNEGLEESFLTEDERGRTGGKIVGAYGDLYQQVPPRFADKAGHVRVEFMESTEDSDWKEVAMERLPHVIRRLQDNGYALRDIAVLVRTNKEGAKVAETLLAYKEKHPEDSCKYEIISDDALFVSGSAAVRFLVTVFRYMQDTESETARKMAVFHYALLLSGEKPEDGEALFVAGKDFPGEIKKALSSLSRESLYETAEELLRLFGSCFKDDEQVYVQAFLDMIKEFAEKESADVARFLAWWDEKGYKKTIVTPDGQDAIRILTVHKSKGLGFKAVILPFGDWEIDHRPTSSVILWCHPKVEPFNALHLVPVRYSSVLSRTIFAAEYYEEKLHAYIDNLNTLYVAFTRAKEELIIFSPRPKKEGNVCGIADLLWAGIDASTREKTTDDSPMVPLSAHFDREEGVFEYGSWWHPVSVRGAHSGTTEIEMRRIASVDPGDRLRLRLYGKGFFFDNEQRKHGTLMHDVLSRIRTVKDIRPAVMSYHYAGVIDKEEYAALSDRLENLLVRSPVASWYDGNARVLNEVDILVENGLSKRPDRVMITGNRVEVVDYKFGLQEKKAYRSQVESYLKLIRRMGYTHVAGYIWYVELDKIEAVNL